MRAVCGRGEKGGMRLGRRTAALIVAAALCVILSFVLTACNEEPVIAPSEQTPSVMTLYSWHEDAESGEVYAYFTTSSVENSLAEAPCGVRSYYGDDGAFWLLSGYSVTFDAGEACAVALAAVPDDGTVGVPVSAENLKIVFVYATMDGRIQSNGVVSESSGAYYHYLSVTPSDGEVTFDAVLRYADSASWYAVLTGAVAVAVAIAFIAYAVARSKRWKRM